MRFSLAHLFAFLIAFSSIGFCAPALEISSEQVATIQSMDSWDSHSLTTPSQKFAEAFSVIAQDFIPIVLISDHSEPAPRFDHYLPIYQLERAKEYFLLI